MQNIALKIFIAENNTKKYILNLASDCLNELKVLITKTELHEPVFIHQHVELCWKAWRNSSAMNSQFSAWYLQLCTKKFRKHTWVRFEAFWLAQRNNQRTYCFRFWLQCVMSVSLWNIKSHIWKHKKCSHAESERLAHLTETSSREYKVTRPRNTDSSHLLYNSSLPFVIC